LLLSSLQLNSQVNLPFILFTNSHTLLLLIVAGRLSFKQLQLPPNNNKVLPTVNMKFISVVATILSMAVFAIAAPVSTAGMFDPRNALGPPETNSTTEIDARQNHGMCVKSTDGVVEQIPDC
jgi:hypothetical protein